jgi:chaperonin cofactor prefoldin
LKGQVPSLLEACLHKRKVQQDYSELDKRSEFSRNIVKRLVRAICAEQHRNERLELQLKNAASNNSVALDALAATNETLRSRINDLEAQNNELHERHSSVQREFKGR